jgi:sulfatase maturation enzyme AslB (radical SAM superfamily)
MFHSRNLQQSRSPRQQQETKTTSHTCFHCQLLLLLMPGTPSSNHHYKTLQLSPKQNCPHADPCLIVLYRRTWSVGGDLQAQQ